MARFTLPRDLYHGKGSLEELKNLKGKRAVVVVGGGSMKKFGFSGPGGGVSEGSRHGGAPDRGRGAGSLSGNGHARRRCNAGIPARLDRRHGRRFSHRRGQDHVGVL